MDYLKVFTLANDLQLLINHNAEKKNDNFIFNRCLYRNSEILNKARQEFRANSSQEFIALQEKAIELAKKSEETPNVNMDLLLGIGIELLQKEDKKQYDLLLEEHNKNLTKESDVDLYTINESDISNIKIDQEYMSILDNFIKK